MFPERGRRYRQRTGETGVRMERMQVGRYEILGIIGKGASSKVARAFDPLIGRIVAVKMFSSDLARPEERKRFVQEARVVGQISHPSIIALHDMGIDEASQTPYLVMEFVEGQSLEKVLEKGSIPFPKACAWGARRSATTTRPVPKTTATKRPASACSSTIQGSATTGAAAHGVGRR